MNLFSLSPSQPFMRLPIICAKISLANKFLVSLLYWMNVQYCAIVLYSIRQVWNQLFSNKDVAGANAISLAINCRALGQNSFYIIQMSPVCLLQSIFSIYSFVHNSSFPIFHYCVMFLLLLCDSHCWTHTKFEREPSHLPLCVRVFV